MEKSGIQGKRKARKIAVQALYQWQMTGSPLYEIEAQFRANDPMEKVDTAYFTQLLRSIPEHVEEIDACFAPYLDREVQALNPIELVVLRLGTYELLFCPELPYKVVLDEAITLTKTFGSQDGYKYVNGVLNHVAEKTRPFEKG